MCLFVYVCKVYISVCVYICMDMRLNKTLIFFFFFNLGHSNIYLYFIIIFCVTCVHVASRFSGKEKNNNLYLYVLKKEGRRNI